MTSKKVMRTSESTDVGTGSICKFRMPAEKHDNWIFRQEDEDDSTEDEILVVNKPQNRHHPRRSHPMKLRSIEEDVEEDVDEVGADEVGDEVGADVLSITTPNKEQPSVAEDKYIKDGAEDGDGYGDAGKKQQPSNHRQQPSDRRKQRPQQRHQQPSDRRHQQPRHDRR